MPGRCSTFRAPPAALFNRRLHQHILDFANSVHQTVEKQFLDPNKSWTDTPAIVTTTKYGTVNDSAPTVQTIFGQPKHVTNPDGTMSFFKYEKLSNGGLTTTERSGEPNANGPPDDILNGTLTTTTTDGLGKIVLRQVDAIIAGALGITIASETYDYSTDPLEQSHTVTTLDGKTITYNYACCGLDSVTDKDGAQTTYEVDSLKRQVATMRYFGGGSGIKFTNVLDDAGRVLESRRISTGGNVMTLAAYGYDVLGRQIRYTNALGGITTNLYLNNGNGLREVTLYADGGTRTNDYYRDGRLEKVYGNAVAPVRYDYGVEPDGVGGINRAYTLETKLNASWSTTPEWTKTYADGMGNSYKTVFAKATTPYPYHQSFYDPTKGQLIKELDSDGTGVRYQSLYQYNAEGELAYRAVDMNQDGTIDFGGANGFDRITGTIKTYIVNASSVPVRRIETRVWATDNQDVGKLVSIEEDSTAGLKSWRTVYRDQSTPVTTISETVYGTSGARTMTAIAADGSSVVSAYSYGRIQSVTRKDSFGAPLSATTYTYDTHGRQSVMTDARNGATTFTFNVDDQVASVTTPPGPVGMPQVTANTHDKLGRLVRVLKPDGTWVTNKYDVTGLLTNTFGSGVYPVFYTYDPQWRLKTMKTWQDFNESTGLGTSGAATTTWNYDQYRGWLEKKVYDGETDNTLDYEYLASGKLWKRHWERGVTTTYAYNNAGDLSNVTYSGGSVSTPSVTYTYDRLGRRKTVTQNSITTTLSYNDASQVLTEANQNSTQGGILDDITVSHSFDDHSRPEGVSVLNGTTTIHSVVYAYDEAGRLGTVTSGDNSATYGYVTDSALISTVTFKQNVGGTPETRLTTTKTYDKLNRLSNISSINSQPSTINSFAYQYNNANQRVRADLADGTHWEYTYDNLGQVISGKRYWHDGTPVAGQQYEYGFDDIGNRKTTAVGGDANGGGLRSATYSPNSVNQYSTRTVPAYVDVLGIANPTASVTVNGNTAYRKGEYFDYALNTPNSGGPWFNTVTIASTYAPGQSSAGSMYVPQTPEAYTPDLDGNLTQDGRWDYSWDGENRLVQIVKRFPTTDLATVPHPTTGVATLFEKVTFQYDYQGRRIARHYFATAGGSTPFGSYHYVYDGWNLLAELNTSNLAPRTYTWGLDLSATMQDAGGVGGLLWMSEITGGAVTESHFAAYDGNGNVTALVKSSDGTETARYEYGPFGESIRKTGAKARTNSFQFSSKFTDDETGMLYYGYRFYNATTGRWLGRDPIGERGGINVYASCRNSPPNFIDADGRFIKIVIGGAVLVVGATACVAISCRMHMNRIQSTANAAAIAEMQRVNPEFDENLDSPNRNPGLPVDALRHCIGSCMANQNPGACVSASFVRNQIQGRENDPGLMGQSDAANNQVGFGITGGCVQGCITAMRNGTLQCYSAGDTVLSPCRVPNL